MAAVVEMAVMMISSLFIGFFSGPFEFFNKGRGCMKIRLDGNIMAYVFWAGHFFIMARDPYE
ncbi:hypothetical protein [Levilinea saccharolytica]|uniref:Uncharacterized protein n=1 Tax=Levilinea saccharolytica TaxID=229921 RepID=A0A0P6XZA0_9CHLR|nr:hypothetical protein ADN01_09205 [Levilinea saccharolytica]GAP17949.1 hypothetical protein LSAC_01830 [Levilinea saccharolytica]